MSSKTCYDISNEGIYYFRNKQRRAWEADKDCREKGRGRLAVFSQSGLFDSKMLNYEGKCMTSSYTIGLKTTAGGGYVWMDGTPANLDNWNIQPPNINGAEWYGSVTKSKPGVITFNPGSAETNYLCFKPSTPTETPATTIATSTFTSATVAFTATTTTMTSSSNTSTAAVTSALTSASHASNLAIAVGVVSALFVIAMVALMYVLVCKRKRHVRGDDVKEAKPNAVTVNVRDDAPQHVYHSIDELNERSASGNYNHLSLDSRDPHQGVYVERVGPA